MGTMLHFGVLPPKDAIADLDFIAGLRNALAAYGDYLTDGDSFSAWGEVVLTSNEAVHVVMPLNNDTVTPGEARSLRSRLADQTIGLPDARVMDYVVATEVFDWSEDVRITGLGALAGTWH